MSELNHLIRTVKSGGTALFALPQLEQTILWQEYWASQCREWEHTIRRCGGVGMPTGMAESQLRTCQEHLNEIIERLKALG